MPKKRSRAGRRKSAKKKEGGREKMGAGEIFFVLPLDKRGTVCYTIMASDGTVICRNGGIGRRPGLKIP